MSAGSRTYPVTDGITALGFKPEAMDWAITRLFGQRERLRVDRLSAGKG